MTSTAEAARPGENAAATIRLIPAGRSQSASPDQPAGHGHSPAHPRHRQAVQSWPLLILALPAAIAVWSGWVGIGQLTGFGRSRV